MSKWDKLIVTLGLIAVALFVYVLATEQMQASYVSSIVRPASENVSEFNDLYGVISRGGLVDVQFAEMTSTDPEDYYFIDYTLSLASICPFPAKWATMNLVPVEGDIVVVQSSPVTIGPFVSGIVTGTLLTTNPDAERLGWIEYYVLGRLKTAVVNI
ncbi:MAG: hypothetical protein Q4D04_01445 [Clostridia bacterium]|nr:hypothetical protein [Clostridia bacterium]